jgi:MoaA/NifB/PqqE/SkfB family radical SAM enzyme
MSSPTQFAQIEPTTRCNYKCGFCAGRSMPQGDLAWETFERFLMTHPNLKQVELQGEGEPLMHPRFFDMAAACHARGIRVSLISNGSLLESGIVNRLIETGVESIHVSLESSDPVEFQTIRGGKFCKVVDGLRLLINRRHELGKDRPTVGFCVTVMRRTLGAIFEITELYKQLGLDGGISIQLLQDMEAYTEHYDQAMFQQLVPHNQWRSFRWLADAAIATVPVQTGASSFYGALFAGYDPSYGACPWLERGTYLNKDGQITGCCYIKNSRHAFGNVMSDAPESIDSRRRAFAEMLREGVIPPACTGCDVARAVTRTGERQGTLLRM